MEGKHCNQEAREKHGFHWTHAWTGSVAGHWGQNWKCLIFIPSHRLQTPLQMEMLGQWALGIPSNQRFSFSFVVLSSVLRLSNNTEWAIFRNTSIGQAGDVKRHRAGVCGADLQRPFLNNFLHKRKSWGFGSACEIRYTHCDGDK